MLPKPMKLYAAFAAAGLLLSCGPKGVTDQALTTDIQAKLYANDATRAAAVKVAVANGTVTLTGDVPSADVETQAMNIAKGTTGVQGVTDQMKVVTPVAQAVPPPEPAAPAPVTPAPAPVKATPAATPPPPPPADNPPWAAPVAAAPPAPARPPRPVTRTVTIPVGTRISVRMIDGIDSGKNTEGQTFRASLDAPITANNRVIVPAGAPATVLITGAKGAGRIKGQSSLELRVSEIEYAGGRVPVDTSVLAQQGSARGKQTAVRTGIGAAAGAVIGAIAGGGKGAAIGSLAGGGAGAGYQLATHGQQIKVPAETQLSFRLEAPLTLTVTRQPRTTATEQQ